MPVHNSARMRSSLPWARAGWGKFIARDRRLKRNIAGKVVPKHLAEDPDALSRFEWEAKAVAALAHPNILAIHDVGPEGEASDVVMELLEGETLRGRVCCTPMQSASGPVVCGRNLMS